MQTVHGVITLAQEHRFQLMDDQGTRKLFIVAHGSAVQGRDLDRLAQDRRRVAVSYVDSAMLNGFIAYDVYEEEDSDG